MNEIDKDRASDWYRKHKVHVDKLVSESDRIIKPSDEDINHPDLWKSYHWRWFFHDGITEAPTNQ